MSEDQTQKLDGSDDDKLDQLLTLVQAMSLDLADVKTRLTALEEKVEERLYDTRPVWEGVQAQIAGLRETQEKIIDEQAKIRDEQEKLRIEQENIREEIQTSYRRLGHKIDFVGNQLTDLYADQRDADRRVDELEKKIS